MWAESPEHRNPSIQSSQLSYLIPTIKRKKNSQTAYVLNKKLECGQNNNKKLFQLKYRIKED